MLGPRRKASPRALVSTTAEKGIHRSRTSGRSTRNSVAPSSLTLPISLPSMVDTVMPMVIWSAPGPLAFKMPPVLDASSVSLINATLQRTDANHGQFEVARGHVACDTGD